MITEIKTEVQRILDKIAFDDYIFLRGQDPDANELVRHETVGTKLIVVMQDEDPIDGDYYESTFPLFLKFLYKDDDNSPTQDQRDMLQTQARIKAKEFYNELHRSPLRGPYTPIENASYNPVDSKSEYDDKFSGIDFSVDFPVYDGNYNYPC